MWHSVPINSYPQWSYWDYSGGGSWQTVSGGTTPPQSTIASSIVSTTFNFTGTGQFTRGTERPVTINSTIFDCSAWVYFVLLKINPTLANQIGSNTSAIKSYASTHGGYHAIPKIGDIAVWGQHVEIVVGYDGTYVTISGSRGRNGTPVPSNEGENWLTPSTMNQISPNFHGFWTIIQEL